MADQIMVIEGLENLEVQGVSRDRVSIALARLREIEKRRAFAVTNLERRMVMMRKELEKLDRSGQDRAKRMRLYDEFVAAGKRHDTERRLRDLTGEKINALRAGNLVEYKRLVMQERSVARIRKRVVRTGPRTANAITAALTAVNAKKLFAAHVTEPAKAVAAHRELLKSRKALKTQYVNLRKRLRILAAMQPSRDREAAIAKTQGALLVVKRGLAMTVKSVMAQQRILTQRRYVQPGMVRSRPATAALASLPAGVESIEVVDTAGGFDLGGYQVEEVDVGSSDDYLKDIKGAGESFAKAKSEVDKFSEGVDAAAEAVGISKGSPSKGGPVAQQQALTADTKLLNVYKIAKSARKKDTKNRILNGIYYATGQRLGKFTAQESYSPVETAIGDVNLAKGPDPKPGHKTYWPTAQANYTAAQSVFGKDWGYAVGVLSSLKGTLPKPVVKPQTELQKLASSLRDANASERPTICQELLAKGYNFATAPGGVHIACKPYIPGLAKEEPKSEGMSTGAKIGIVAAALAAVSGAVYFVIKRKRKGLGDVDESYAHAIYEND